jgi:hypothetical protein
MFGDGKVPSSSLIDKMMRQFVDPPLAVLDERTVEKFCDSIREGARLYADHPLLDDPTDKAEAFRYILNIIAYSIDAGLLNADPAQPMWSQPYRIPLLDWGNSSPDSVYRRVSIREDLAYRIDGRISNARHWSIDFRQASKPGTILAEDIACDADGGFELFLGGAPREKNWFPIPPGSQSLVLREYFDDWTAAVRSPIAIECLDDDATPYPVNHSGRIAAAFDVVAEWMFEGGIRYWAQESARMRAQSRNRFVGGTYRTDARLPSATMALWEVQPDEALIVEFDDPGGEFWAMQLSSTQWRTLDYANRIVTQNNAQAKPDPDGKYRLVIAGQDPGLHNWLDTTGLRCGIAIMRYWRPANTTPPQVTAVKLQDVARLLPGAPRCSPDERRAQVKARRRAVARMVFA